MKSTAWVCILAAAISTGACKKQVAPPPAPAKPLVEVTLSDASFAGKHTGDTTGKLSVPVSLMNNHSSGLQISAVSIAIMDDNGAQVCGAKITGDKLAPANSWASDVEIDCAYEKFGGSRDLKVTGTVVFSADGDTKTKKIRGQVKLVN